MYSPARGHVELIAPRGGIRQELFKREGKALPMAKNISCGFDGKPVHRPGHFVFADGPDLLLMPQDKTDAQPGNAAALRERAQDQDIGERMQGGNQAGRRPGKLDI